jgi:hypothetical protein
MKIPKLGDQRFIVPLKLFDSSKAIQHRVDAVAPAVRRSVSLALRYLYLTDGPFNLPRVKLRQAWRSLSEAEQKAVRWLATRTNGSLRKRYGSRALEAAGRSRLRWESRGVAEVRVLNLDHVDGHTPGTAFRCLFTNCHHIKFFHGDWQGAIDGRGVTSRARQHGST